MSDGHEDPDRYTKSALEALRLAMWCKEHRTTLFFCEHRHLTTTALPHPTDTPTE